MSKIDSVETYLDDPDAVAFAKLVLASLELERKGRSEAGDNSSHQSSIEGFSKASAQVAQLLQHA